MTNLDTSFGTLFFLLYQPHEAVPIARNEFVASARSIPEVDQAERE